jgi:hypothetical protein
MLTISKEKGLTDAMEDDTFVPSYPNLDPQDTLIDAHDNGAGIIDWGENLAIPCYISYASLPEFFRRD